MHRELPAARAAHGEPADRDPVVVDRQQRLHVGDRLQHVDFAGELEGVAVAAVGMEHDRVGRDDRARITEPLVKELHLADLLAPAVQPDVEAAWLRVGDVEVGRQDEAVGLDRTVDPRTESADCEPRLCRRTGRIVDDQGPSAALREHAEPSACGVEQSLRLLDLLLVVEKPVLDGELHGAGEHEHLGAVGVARSGGRVHVACQCHDGILQSRPRGVVEFDADGGNRSNGRGKIVSGAVRPQARRHDQHDQHGQHDEHDQEGRRCGDRDRCCKGMK